MKSAELPLDAPARRRLPPLLRKAWYGLNQAFRRRIIHLRTTPDQFTVLRLLSEAPPAGLTQRELGGLMYSDPNTIAALLSRMEANGLISRRPHEADGRAHRVCVEKKGMLLFRKLRSLALKLQESLLEHLPPERREQFLIDLETVADACAAEASSGTKKVKSEKGKGKKERLNVN